MICPGCKAAVRASLHSSAECRQVQRIIWNYERSSGVFYVKGNPETGLEITGPKN